MDKELSVGISEGQFENVLATAYSPTVTLSELIKNASDACDTTKDTITIEVDEEKKTAIVTDNGVGLSEKDIIELASVGQSQKMRDGNILSAIGEPYAGSKGLGILTAFNLCQNLEITTHSKKDAKTYLIKWAKGTKKITYREYESDHVGTRLKMEGVGRNSIKMLTHEDEIKKIFLSSITYYTTSETLPKIKLYVNGIEKTYSQPTLIDDLYHKYNRPKTKSKHEGYFVAKAMFRYSNNTLTISYEDNMYNVCNIYNEDIDLCDINSIRSFLSRHNIMFKDLKTRFNSYDPEVPLDDFEGVFYTWRQRKSADMTYPFGIRIYVNNYGLYNYLGQDNDWTQFSMTSQNVKWTNYTFKNTYGFVNFKNFNEETSSLKISKERNDFTGNLSHKKFYNIMCDFVTGIFTSIDITLRDTKGGGLAFIPLQKNRKTNIDKAIDIRDLLRTDLPNQQLIYEHDGNIEIDQDKGLISVKAVGEHVLKISNGITTEIFHITGEDPEPNFELVPRIPRVREGTTQNLFEFVLKKSCKNVILKNILIESDNADIDKYSLKKTNRPGDYQIKYSYQSDGHPEISRVLDLVVYPLYESDAKQIEKLFPDYKEIDGYYKLNDVVHQISIGYINSPVICGIALRSLIEITIRHFLEDVLGEFPEDKDFVTLHKINYIFTLIGKEDPRLNKKLLDQYGNKLKRNKKDLTDYYKRLDLNRYVHNSESITTSSDILVFCRTLKNFLSFIFKSLIAKNKEATQ
ncbi:MAG: ATP-binding protein [Desulfovibrio sp.]